MERHQRATAANMRTQSEDDALESLATQIAPANTENTTQHRIDLNRGAVSPVEEVREHRAAKPRTMHTLVLIGELDRRSTHTLETEIERLCEVGVNTILLDLSQLSGIDRAGISVLVFRAGW